VIDSPPTKATLADLRSTARNARHAAPASGRSWSYRAWWWLRPYRCCSRAAAARCTGRRCCRPPGLSRGGAAATVLNASGYVTPRRRATVSAKITGKVIEVLVDEGMPRHGGQVSPVDDSGKLAAARPHASARRLAVSAADEIVRSLWPTPSGRFAPYRRSSASRAWRASRTWTRRPLRLDALRARLEVARRSLAAAEAELAVTLQDLENYTVRAPFDGIAVSKDAQQGEMVSPVSAGGGFTRTGISTHRRHGGPSRIEVDVSESYIAKVSPGQPADAGARRHTPIWHMPANRPVP